MKIRASGAAALVALNRYAQFQKLMKALIEKKITMVDYETLTDKKNNRIIAFGRYAGLPDALKIALSLALIAPLSRSYAKDL